MSPHAIQQAELAELERRRKAVDRLLEDPRIQAHGELVLRLRAALSSVRAHVDQELARRERVLHQARHVRNLQRQYFSTRDRKLFFAAKDAERDLDRLIAPQTTLDLEEGA